MSVESFDEELRRGLVHWPRPQRVEPVAWDDAWPARFRAHRDALSAVPGGGGAEHIGATAVPGLAAVPVVDVLLPVDALDPASHAVLALGWEPWFVSPEVRAFRRYDAGDGAVSLRLCPPCAAAPYRALRDRLAAGATARRRYTDVRRGLAGTWADLRDYAAAKGPVIRALLAEPSPQP